MGFFEGRRGKLHEPILINIWILKEEEFRIVYIKFCVYFLNMSKFI